MSGEEKNSDMTPKSNGLDKVEPMDEGDSVNEDELDALEEIASVNDNLDNLSSFLDSMEQRTDDIKAQLMELLMSNREIRESIIQENESDKPDQSQEPSAQPN